MDNEIDREHRNRRASGGSNLGWGRVSAATNIQITYRLLMLYLGIVQGSGVLWWYGVDSVSPASNCPVHRRKNWRKLTIIIRVRGGLLRPRPDGGDPAPPPQPAAGRPAGGAPQHQRARAETELHTGGMSYHYISYCDVMSCYDNILSPGGWGAGECDGHGDGPHDGPGHARHRGGGRQRRRHGRDEHAQPRQAGGY